jgi:hypothetical protein
MRLRAFVPIGAIAFVSGLFRLLAQWLHTRVATWFVIRMHAGVALDEERLVCFPESLPFRQPMAADKFRMFPS